jgi:hypothetical protein
MYIHTAVHNRSPMPPLLIMWMFRGRSSTITLAFLTAGYRELPQSFHAYMRAEKSLTRPERKRLTEHLQHRRNWPTWASKVLITQPILRIWPRRTTTCSLDSKTIDRDEGRAKDLSAPQYLGSYLSVSVKDFFQIVSPLIIHAYILAFCVSSQNQLQRRRCITQLSIHIAHKHENNMLDYQFIMFTLVGLSP